MGKVFGIPMTLVFTITNAASAPTTQVLNLFQNAITKGYGTTSNALALLMSALNSGANGPTSSMLAVIQSGISHTYGVPIQIVSALTQAGQVPPSSILPPLQSAINAAYPSSASGSGSGSGAYPSHVTLTIPQISSAIPTPVVGNENIPTATLHMLEPTPPPGIPTVISPGPLSNMPLANQASLFNNLPAPVQSSLVSGLIASGIPSQTVTFTIPLSKPSSYSATSTAVMNVPGILDHLGGIPAPSVITPSTGSGGSSNPLGGLLGGVPGLGSVTPALPAANLGSALPVGNLQSAIPLDNLVNTATSLPLNNLGIFNQAALSSPPRALLPWQRRPRAPPRLSSLTLVPFSPAPTQERKQVLRGAAPPLLMLAELLRMLRPRQA